MQEIITDKTFNIMKQALSAKTGIKSDSLLGYIITYKLIEWPGVSMNNFIKLVKKRNLIKV